MVSMVKFTEKVGKRTIVTYKVIKSVGQFYDLSDYFAMQQKINFCAKWSLFSYPTTYSITTKNCELPQGL